MPIPDTFALDVGKSNSSICVNIVVQTSAFWLRKALLRKHNFSVSVALLPSPQPVNSLRNRVKLASGWGSAPEPAGGAYDAPPDLLVGWEGIGLHRPLSVGAFGTNPPRKCLVTGL